MKKVAILNDIHSGYPILEKILKELESEHIDEYLICGDSITDGFQDNEVLDTLRKLPSTFINGNRELSVLNDYEKIKDFYQWGNTIYSCEHLNSENKEFISKLPIYKIITIENVKICMSHGSPYHVRDLVAHDDYTLFDKLISDFDCDVYLFAHTHIAFTTKYKKRLFVNSGAISSPSDGPKSSYGILTINDKEVNYEQRYYHYDFEKIKEYYLNSEYHQLCQVWSNLLIYNFKYGKDYCIPFIMSIKGYNNNEENIPKEVYNTYFKKYMEDNNLEIL